MPYYNPYTANNISISTLENMYKTISTTVDYNLSDYSNDPKNIHFVELKNLEPTLSNTKKKIDKEKTHMSSKPKELQILHILAKSKIGRDNLTLVLPNFSKFSREEEQVLYNNNLSAFYVSMNGDELSEIPAADTQQVVFIINALDNIENPMVKANIIHSLLSSLRKDLAHMLAITSNKMNKNELEDLVMFAGSKRIYDKPIKELDKLKCTLVLGN